MEDLPAVPDAVISLIGYRCTGKTTVGRLLAQRLGWEFADADQLVQGMADCGIAEIFREQGESVFRDWEEQAIAQLVQKSPLVLSVGGGAVMRSSNATAMKLAGAICWLTASEDEIVNRLKADTKTHQQRPALTDKSVLDEVTDVLREREPVYRECATFTIDTEGKTSNEVAELIFRRMMEEDASC